MSDTESEPQLILKRATMADIHGILRVQKETWIATYSSEELGISREDIVSMDLEGKKQRERVKRHIESQGEKGSIWVAKEGDEVVGFSHAEKEQEMHELRAIYVLPHLHGKGVGRLLMESTMEWFGTEKPVYVWVAASNQRAVAFYKKFGFATTGKAENLPLETVNGSKNLPIIQLIRS